MMLPNLRYLSSMRARMTAGFVFILAPCLLIASAILPILANRVTEIKDREQVGWIVERVSQRMAEPDWRARLADLMAAKALKESHVALLIVDAAARLAWRSPGPGPAWPPEAGSNWRREMRKITAQFRVKAPDKPSAAREPADREPVEPRKPLEEWRLVVGKAQALAQARALEEAKAA